MSTTTPNFGWTIPSDTDLVTDGAAAMRDLGDGIDTSFVDLNGGTTGQILSKTSATDLDFTWITNDVGDITSVGVTSPITGGGSSGVVTIAIQDALTTQKGAVQLSDSTSTTSSILAATPTAVKAAYDLANGAIPKTLTTTTGDTIYASSANTPARLGIGSTGQVLTVASGLPSWATPAASGNQGCFLYLTAGNTTIANGTDTVISWTNESWDTDAFHSTSVNTSRITIPAGLGGKYLLIANPQFSNNATGRRITVIKVNGTTVRDWEAGVSTSSGYMNLVLPTILNLVATDYIEVFVFQTSGGNLDLIGSAVRSTSVMISFLGA